MTETNSRRARRELRTVGAMIAIYCRENHGATEGLCADCQVLEDYARQRVDRCPLLADKPTCVNCPIHCYKPAMKERIRVVMRFAGPRMLWRHPFLAVSHLLDGWRDRSRNSTAER